MDRLRGTSDSREKIKTNKRLYRSNRKCTGILFGLAIGFFIGFVLSFLISWSLEKYCKPYHNKLSMFDESAERGFLFVGVMTTKDFIDTRAAAVYKSWARSINGRVVFFSSEDTPPRSDIPVVSLQNVDDVYPPQKKAFYLLKYMADHVVDNYEFFLRIDDDCFIKGDLLEKFLRSVNSTKMWMIGQTGMGNKLEHGHLGLEGTWNYCMGGPGVVFTRDVLVKIAPHIENCLDSIYTQNEDVELGRCVNRFAGISCTWSYEMQELFFHNYKEPQGSFINKSLQDPEVQRAITLHPIKIPEHQFRIHNHFTSRQITDLSQKRQNLHKEISDISRMIENKNFTAQGDTLPQNDNTMWAFFDNKSMSSNKIANPRISLAVIGYNKTVIEMCSYAVKLSKPNNTNDERTLHNTKLICGYVKNCPYYGAYYMLTLKQTFKLPKRNGKIDWATLKTNSYLKQEFSDTEFVEDGLTDDQLDKHIYSDQEYQSDPLIRLKQNIGAVELISPKLQKIHFIVSLAGRFPTFKRFMAMFEKIFLSKYENVELHIVWFKDVSSKEEQILTMKIVSTYQKAYGDHFIDLISLNKSSFARAMALSIGANRTSSNDLLFFVDIDLIFTSELLGRIRLNTIRGVQIYYPITFSQYDPRYVCGNTSVRLCKKNIFDFSFRRGFWRHFGTGIVCIYRDDFDKVGGFDTSYIGWGGEDSKLYEQVILSKYTVFRAADPGLVHIHHSKECDTSLDKLRFEECIGSKGTEMASQRQLAEMTFNLQHVLNRN